MATLFALIYPNATGGKEADAAANGLDQAGFIELLDQVVVTKWDDGKISYDGQNRPVRWGALTGVVLGGITGLLFAIPVIGIAAGAALGAYFGKLITHSAEGEFNAFRETVGKELQPGGAALLLLIQTNARERTIQDLGRHGGTLHSIELTDEQIAEIQKQIDRASGC